MLLPALIATSSTAPPSISSGITNTLTPLADRFMTMLNDLWDVGAPWLTLLVALRLFFWFLSWRARGRTPGSGGDEW